MDSVDYYIVQSDPLFRMENKLSIFFSLKLTDTFSALIRGAGFRPDREQLPGPDAILSGLFN